MGADGERTIHDVVAAGRARWKIENEGTNVLKNRGYHMEHNLGHGQHYLASVLLMLLLLAFLFQTVLQLCDQKYQRVRAELATRMFARLVPPPSGAMVATGAGDTTVITRGDGVTVNDVTGYIRVPGDMRARPKLPAWWRAAIRAVVITSASLI